MASTSAVVAQHDEADLDLYTIPLRSSWFRWDAIHDIERIALKEFFDGSSISRTPRIYKEYRDFIINKFRENPSKTLTFTHIRKSLVGDVSLLHKVFLFLDYWGLINFGVPNHSQEEEEEQQIVDDDAHGTPSSSSKLVLQTEEGPPSGIRVVAMPNSSRPVSLRPSVTSRGGSAPTLSTSNTGSKPRPRPPLASFSDVFGDRMKHKPKAPACKNCGGTCDSGHYQCSKQEEFVICVNCYESRKFGENNTADDFKGIDDGSSQINDGAVWTEAEILLLLESVLRHGDDWELVAQNVKTKTRAECILKLIELPFGEFMIGSAYTGSKLNDLVSEANKVDQVQSSQEDLKIEDPCDKQVDLTEENQNGDIPYQGPHPKRKRIAATAEGCSLMKQVASMSAMVGPKIAAAAAESAVASICSETSCSSEIFNVQGDPRTNGLLIPSNNKAESANQDQNSEITDERPPTGAEEMAVKKTVEPLQIRAATATALGAAAAHAKLLADQEDTEIEQLVATIVDTQMKKVKHKIKHFDNLEMIMEKEYAELDALKELIVSERIKILQRTVKAGISRWRDHASQKL